MAGIYAKDDDGGFHNEEKPTWDDDIDIDDILPPTASSSTGKKENKEDRKKGRAAGDEGEDYEMGESDEAYREDEEWDEEWDGTEEMRKEKLQEYMNSLLELEFNDVVSATTRGTIPPVFLIIRLARSLGSLRDSNTQPPPLRLSG